VLLLDEFVMPGKVIPNDDNHLKLV